MNIENTDPSSPLVEDIPKASPLQWHEVPLPIWRLNGISVLLGDLLEYQSDQGVWKQARFENAVENNLLLFSDPKEGRLVSLPYDILFRWPPEEADRLVYEYEKERRKRKSKSQRS
jgi:hypothetical protein